MKRLALGILMTLVTCNYNPEARIPIEAANALTRDYAKHDLTAYAAGRDCRVLLISAAFVLDDASVETIHYGTGEPAYPGGLQQFAGQRTFRAVVYKDSAGSLWTYGSITREEARSMPVCR